MGSSGYILRFTLIMTVITALVLAGMFYVTEPYALRSEAVFNKRAILSAVRSQLGGDKFDELSDQQVLDIFEKQVEQLVVNMQGEVVEGEKAENISLAQEKKKPESNRLLPVFIYNSPDDSKKYYILSIRGNGLWDEIWGNIALESDLNTVAGASFDHKGETPGLGAEIKDNPTFPAAFINKKMYNDKGEFVSIVVRKGGARDPQHEVDAITGSTITSNGVTEMIERGITYYKPYLDKLKKS